MFFTLILHNNILDKCGRDESCRGDLTQTFPNGSNIQNRKLLGRRHSKTRLTIDKRGSKIARNSVFDCNLSPVGRQMAIGNSVSNDSEHL